MMSRFFWFRHDDDLIEMRAQGIAYNPELSSIAVKRLKVRSELFSWGMLSLNLLRFVRAIRTPWTETGINPMIQNQHGRVFQCENGRQITKQRVSISQKGEKVLEGWISRRKFGMKRMQNRPQAILPQGPGICQNQHARKEEM